MEILVHLATIVEQLPQAPGLLEIVDVHLEGFPVLAAPYCRDTMQTQAWNTDCIAQG